MSHPLFRLFEMVDRLGPGSPGDTIRAWSALAPPPKARVVEMGAGAGAATRVLLAHTDAVMTAIDQHGPFLERLFAWARAQGVSDRLDTVVADMASPPVEPASVDVVWSEGAAYAIGFERALKTWRPLLVEDGSLALSELVWRTECPPEAARTFFADEYPAMTHPKQCVAVARRCGYRVVDDFFVSAEGWESYYTPLLSQVDRFEAAAAEEPGVAEVVAAIRAEGQVYRDYGDSFGYLFLALKKAPSDAGKLAR